jgi:hypothetical protein
MHDLCRSSILAGTNKPIIGLVENMWIHDSVLIQISVCLLYMTYFE